jgi:hypothetical protein
MPSSFDIVATERDPTHPEIVRLPAGGGAALGTGGADFPGGTFVP